MMYAFEFVMYWLPLVGFIALLAVAFVWSWKRF